MTNKRWAVLALLVVLMATLFCPARAESTATAEEVAREYFAAFQEGEWLTAQGLADDAALSWVEYVGSREGKTDGLASIMKIETANLGDSVRAKIYYQSSDGQVRLRYLKLRDIAGRYRVVDDKMLGGEWISLSYRKGLFAKAKEIGGVRVRVVGILEVPPEIKFDIIVENLSGPEECLIYPSLEAFYVVEADGAVRGKYFAQPPAAVPEKPLRRGEAMRTYSIVPFWSVDSKFAGRAIKSLTWTLYVPYGPIDQYAFDYI
ncbi:MAG: hypothetical protein PHP20_06655 [Firmicutes bacterium]|jgi:hypothetical protein|nr:hypothetical protein [Bacillota bacterium]MDD4336790.1 hypothetical protein [Bacillota bacterium]MDD4792731.1 hypothetical protein [Bacillota bacterium]